MNKTREMARGSPAKAGLGERFFRVQVRVLIPADGWGAQLGMICRWLDAHIGDGNYCAGTGSADGPDTARFLFLDASDARAFIGRFACGMVPHERGRAQEPTLSREAPR